MGDDLATLLFSQERGLPATVSLAVIDGVYALLHPLAFRCSLDHLDVRIGRFEALTLDLLSCMSVSLVSRILAPGGEDLRYFSAGTYVAGFPLLLFLLGHWMVFWIKKDSVYMSLGRGTGKTISMSLFLLSEALVMLESGSAISHLFGVRGFFVFLLSFSSKRLVFSMARYLSMARDSDLQEREFKEEYAGGFLDTQVVRALAYFLALTCLSRTGVYVSTGAVLAFEVFLVGIYVYVSVSLRGPRQIRGEIGTGPTAEGFLDDLFGSLTKRKDARGARRFPDGTASTDFTDSTASTEPLLATHDSAHDSTMPQSAPQQIPNPDMQFAPNSLAILSSLSAPSMRKG